MSVKSKKKKKHKKNELTSSSSSSSGISKVRRHQQLYSRRDSIPLRSAGMDRPRLLRSKTSLSVSPMKKETEATTWMTIRVRDEVKHWTSHRHDTHDKSHCMQPLSDMVYVPRVAIWKISVGIRPSRLFPPKSNTPVTNGKGRQNERDPGSACVCEWETIPYATR